jgi:hypothetical protein
VHQLVDIGIEIADGLQAAHSEGTKDGIPW